MTTPDHHDPFEHGLRTRLDLAAAAVTATGVTREAVDDRVAARRRRARRRQGGLAIAAAAVVVGLGVGAALASPGGPETTRTAGTGGSASVVRDGSASDDPGSPEPSTTEEDAPPGTVCELLPSTTVTLPEVTAVGGEELGPSLVCHPAEDETVPEPATPPSTTSTTSGPTEGPTGSPPPIPE